MTHAADLTDVTATVRTPRTPGRISTPVGTLEGSAILKIAGEIRQRVAAGERVCNLTVGDFDPLQFPVPNELLEGTRAALAGLYASDVDDATKLQRKAVLMAAMRAEHAALKARPDGPWAGFSGYDGWFNRANNASLALQAAYDGLVPQFEALFRQQGGDFARFHAEVRRLAALPADQRRAALDQSQP